MRSRSSYRPARARMSIGFDSAVAKSRLYDTARQREGAGNQENQENQAAGHWDKSLRRSAGHA